MIIVTPGPERSAKATIMQAGKLAGPLFEPWTWATEVSME